MGRTAFFSKIGADFANPRWSWSAVNHAKREVYFGVFDTQLSKSMGKILSESWEIRRGRKQPGYSDAIKKIQLVSKKDYNLLVFEMKQGRIGDEIGPATIKSISEELRPAKLAKFGVDWFAIFKNDVDDIPEQLSPHEVQNLIEGAKKTIVINAYERNKDARQTCISYYGYSCQACGFSFLKAYGKLGEDFIHVHHLNPIAAANSEYNIDPVKDLIPLCPNCHAMVHRQQPPMTLQTLKDIISANAESR